LWLLENRLQHTMASHGLSLFLPRMNGDVKEPLFIVSLRVLALAREAHVGHICMRAASSN